MYLRFPSPRCLVSLGDTCGRRLGFESEITQRPTQSNASLLIFLPPPLPLSAELPFSTETLILLFSLFLFYNIFDSIRTRRFIPSTHLFPLFAAYFWRLAKAYQETRSVLADIAILPHAPLALTRLFFLLLEILLDFRTAELPRSELARDHR